ncbi:vitellogenin receptor-like [Planococcus citri]|uniref:vitellogenin receptor-like n=1 Tax=Planococcus citri TaxID=170843 RepID=UPI0031F89149
MAACVHKVIIFLFVWMMFEIFLDGKVLKPPDYKNFRCNNGKYIPGDYFCDGNNNCRSGDRDYSDESFGCDRWSCNNGTFKCSSDGACINITHRCNTIADCADQSDELNCGGENDIVNCSLDKGKYLCHDKLKCLDYIYTCDGVCNCFDCSDENIDNCYKFDSDFCRSCPLFCLPTPDGPQCACDPNNTNESSQFCSREIRHCDHYTNCDQYCYIYNGKMQCWCSEGFHDVHHYDYPYNKECRSNEWQDNVLIYSTISKIKAINMTSKKVQIIQTEFNHQTALTGANNHIYYARFHNDRSYIFKTRIQGGKADPIIESASSITSLSVDWITQSVYFTSNGSLSVCNNDGKLCVELECCNDADNVVIFPNFGQMYYTEKSDFQNERNVIKSNMDGSEKNILIDASFVHPLSLAINEKKKTLYVYELSTNSLYSISLLEPGAEISMQLQLKTYHLESKEIFSSSFTVLDNQLYFSKPNHSNIIYALHDNHHKVIRDFYTDLETNAIIHLYAYNLHVRQINTSNTENPCKNASCDGLCLLRPISSTNQLNYTCMCQNYSSTTGIHWCHRHSTSTQPIGNLGSNLNAEFTSPNKQTLSGTKIRNEDEMSGEPIRNSTHGAKNDAHMSNDSSVPMVSYSTAPEQNSKFDLILSLGFMSGVALILGVVVLILGVIVSYLIVGKVYSKRSHKRVEIAELMDIQ